MKSSANGGDAVKLAKTGSKRAPAIVATVVMVSSAIFGGATRGVPAGGLI